MARQYSRRTFLRQTPNATLKTYFALKGLLGDIDFDALSETEIEDVSDAIEKLPDAQRVAVDAAFEQVNEMAYGPGIEAILEEAAFRRVQWAELFAQMSGHYERAFWCYQNDPDTFFVAGHFEEMDRRGPGQRRTIYKNLEPKVEQADLDALGHAISELYRKQGRGKNCAVDNYLRRDPERHCYFVYPEDHPVTEPSFDDDGKLQQVPRLPVFEIILIYRSADGVLELHARGNHDHKDELLKAFCQTILGLDDLPEQDATPDYNLASLKDREKTFPTDPSDGVKSVEIKMLRLDMPGGCAKRIVLEANPSDKVPQALYDLMDDALDTERVPLASVHVARARIRLTFAARNGGRAKKLTFEVAHPNRCTLKDDHYDQIAKKYLQLWEIARG